jgi:chemotaxis protein CheC
MADNTSEFGTIQLSAVHELSNIGLGHAITALSNMTNMNFNMSVPNVETSSTTEFSKKFAENEELCVATYMPIDGDLDGYIAFIFKWSAAQALWKMLIMQQPESIEQVGELEVSVMLEVGNILNSSFMNAISEMTGLKIHASPPRVGIEMFASLTNSLLLEAEEQEIYVLSIQTEIFCETEAITGHFMCLPSKESLRKLFVSLGISEEAA